MQEELTIIYKNQNWKLANIPKHKKFIGVMWAFRTNLNAYESINKHKSRLAVKGYTQIFGVDFFDTFSPVARLYIIRILLAIATRTKWKICHLDVNSPLLNGFLEEEISVEQTEGFIAKRHEDKAFLLSKALYGLKQAPIAYYNIIDD